MTTAVGSSVYVWLGNGDGSFQRPISTFVGPYPSDIVVGDFNGDAIADAAVLVIPKMLPRPS